MKLCDPYQQAVLQLREQNTSKDSEILRLHDDITTASTRLRDICTSNDFEILRLSGGVAAASAEISRLRDICSSEEYETLRLRDENTVNASEVLRLRQEVLKLAADHDLKIRSDVEKIGRLKAQVDQLQKSNDYHTIEALRLTTESLELRSHKVHPDGVPGKL